jgi:hypothetical protein
MLTLEQWLLITCRLLTRKLDASTAQPALRRTGDGGKSTGNLRTKVARHRRNQLTHGFARLDCLFIKVLIHQSRRNSNIKIYRPVQRTGSNNACYPTFDKYSTAASSYCNSRKSHYRKTLSIILPTSPLWLSRSLCKHHEPLLFSRRQLQETLIRLPAFPRLNIVLTQTRLGATGFIGGDLLAGLQEQYPEYEITCLVRTQDKADIIRAVYPDVKVVLGDDESAEIVERETMNADIVFRECRFETGSYT